MLSIIIHRVFIISTDCLKRRRMYFEYIIVRVGISIISETLCSLNGFMGFNIRGIIRLVLIV